MQVTKKEREYPLPKNASRTEINRYVEREAAKILDLFAEQKPQEAYKFIANMVDYTYKIMTRSIRQLIVRGDVKHAYGVQIILLQTMSKSRRGLTEEAQKQQLCQFTHEIIQWNQQNAINIVQLNDCHDVVISLIDLLATSISNVENDVHALIGMLLHTCQYKKAWHVLNLLMTYSTILQNEKFQQQAIINFLNGMLYSANLRLYDITTQQEYVEIFCVTLNRIKHVDYNLDVSIKTYLQNLLTQNYSCSTLEPLIIPVIKGYKRLMLTGSPVDNINNTLIHNALARFYLETSKRITAIKATECHDNFELWFTEHFVEIPLKNSHSKPGIYQRALMCLSTKADNLGDNDQVQAIIDGKRRGIDLLHGLIIEICRASIDDINTYKTAVVAPKIKPAKPPVLQIMAQPESLKKETPLLSAPEKPQLPKNTHGRKVKKAEIEKREPKSKPSNSIKKPSVHKTKSASPASSHKASWTSLSFWKSIIPCCDDPKGKKRKVVVKKKCC